MACAVVHKEGTRGGGRWWLSMGSNLTLVAYHCFDTGSVMASTSVCESFHFERLLTQHCSHSSRTTPTSTVSFVTSLSSRSFSALLAATKIFPLGDVVHSFGRTRPSAPNDTIHMAGPKRCCPPTISSLSLRHTSDTPTSCPQRCVYSGGTYDDRAFHYGL